MTLAPEPTPQPGLLRRIALIARFPLGLLISTLRYLRYRPAITRTDQTARAPVAGDRGPALPPGVLDARVKPVERGAGPLYHRTFRVRVRDAALDAAGLIARVTDDLDRAAPSEVVSFRKMRGRLGELRVGDEYRVRMPAPWDGPVRVVDRTATSFRFVTLRWHLEAGQIEFRARDGATDGDLVFEIETWSRPGDRAAHVLFDHLRVGKEIQLYMWTQFCLSVVALTGGRRDGPVTADTRRATWVRPARPAS